MLVDDEIKEKVKEVAEERKEAPEDVFAGMFHTFVPILKQVLPKLSKKQMRRVLNAVIEVPLNDKPYKILDKDERDVYNLVDRLLIAKYAMVLKVLTDRYNEEKKGELEKIEADSTLTDEQKKEMIENLLNPKAKKNEPVVA